MKRKSEIPTEGEQVVRQERAGRTSQQAPGADREVTPHTLPRSPAEVSYSHRESWARPLPSSFFCQFQASSRLPPLWPFSAWLHPVEGRIWLQLFPTDLSSNPTSLQVLALDLKWLRA